jgi:GNAT superfamily N-acetyltransferase
MSTEDFEFAVKLTDRMNWGLAKSDFEFMKELEPEGCFVLLENSHRIGIATTVSYGKIAWFGNLIVEENKRGRGAGSTLVNHALEYLKNRRVSTVGLYAYVERIPFYERLGFSRDIDFLVMKGKAFTSHSDLNVKRAGERDIRKIIDFDKSCFGESREKTLRPIISDSDNFSYVSIKEQRIAGYSLTKAFGGMAELGPVVSEKEAVDIAMSLIKASLNEVSGREVSVFVPENQPQIASELARNGFTQTFKVERMFRGPAVARDCICTAESLERG